jgi:hypothetical protein
MIVGLDRLLPGDILLSLGVGPASTAIRMLDGGQHSHAALWTGQAIIESTMPEVVEHPLKVSLEKHERQHVVVYRHAKCDAAAAVRVVEQARRYIGRSYSLGDLFLCASIMAAVSGAPGRLQLPVLRQVCELLHGLRADLAREGEHVTCTQLVVRAYSSAGLPILVLPGIGGQLHLGATAVAALDLARSKGPQDAGAVGATPDLTPDERAEWARMQQSASDALDALGGPLVAGAVKGPLAGWDLRAPVRAEGEWRANLVTPRYLAESPDLSEIGEIDLTTVDEIDAMP